jgi:hypothetical protein
MVGLKVTPTLTLPSNVASVSGSVCRCFGLAGCLGGYGRGPRYAFEDTRCGLTLLWLNQIGPMLKLKLAGYRSGQVNGSLTLKSNYVTENPKEAHD